jgi:hypothetical protein
MSQFKENLSTFALIYVGMEKEAHVLRNKKKLKKP